MRGVWSGNPDRAITVSAPERGGFGQVGRRFRPTTTAWFCDDLRTMARFAKRNRLRTNPRIESTGTTQR
ncbi:hypothetical protein CEE69_10190 [Rhodopirellula bahusiensis]|uniref:Uncharacterized protein n=1 Tax=Rhodopirellula bahusiensis TaxID=2014065 RepID=A0A2G1W8K3_9BACT|nr:hypothetical protein CEE69_10190 [Rhodopirellula bahusiensis]